MSQGRIRLDLDGLVARITIDRPSARNAMTLAMYDELLAACTAIASDSTLRVAVISGVEGHFCAGTDIGEFRAFKNGEDGVRYEGMIQAVLEGIEQLPIPTVAAVDGPAMGGGLLIAAACDFRVLTDRARLGAPMARTLGNLLAPLNVARLERNLGLSLVRRVLILAETIDADQACDVGFAIAKVPIHEIEARVSALIGEIGGMAPLTVSAVRQSLAHGGVFPDSSELVSSVYQSADFREGISAFLEKRRANWTGT